LQRDQTGASLQNTIMNIFSLNTF